MEGTKLGKYDLRAELGRGAMGTVYAAWDPVIERKIAIKTVNLPAGDADEARAMLQQIVSDSARAAEVIRGLRALVWFFLLKTAARRS